MSRSIRLNPMAQRGSEVKDIRSFYRRYSESQVEDLFVKVVKLAEKFQDSQMKKANDSIFESTLESLKSKSKELTTRDRVAGIIDLIRPYVDEASEFKVKSIKFTNEDEFEQFVKELDAATLDQ